ncbi:MAG: alpha-ketoacid dehydrogenase subunit beta [Alphaproteobacteria bacterium]|nr:alpha-ketoacid dehydrogenase subunit beta [Alphaproteobacteria bacterium]
MTTMSYKDAARLALAEEMRRDATVWALGEDVSEGGVFGQYLGLVDEFGPARVVSTPISEATIMGAAVGAAMVGTRPVVELRFSDFALCAVDEMVNQAAKARYMFGGQTRAPLVIRQPIGMWRSSAAQHSQSLESWYVHVPGFVVLAPGTPEDNRGLLKSAIRCDDPVIYMEHKDSWDMEGEVPDGDDGAVPIGEARIDRTGDDVTIVTWSGALQVARQAADAAADKDVSVEIIDLRSLWPWDQNAVFASVEKTGRLAVVHEAVKVCGFGAEIAATVSETMGDRLKSPVRRLGAPRIPIPYAPPLEDLCRVRVADVMNVFEEMGV